MQMDLKAMGVVPIEPPAPTRPMPNQLGLGFDATDFDESDIEPPVIRDLAELMLACAPASPDCEFWQVLAMRAALEMSPENWRLPITDYREAITSLQVWQGQAELPESMKGNNSASFSDPMKRAEFVRSINVVFEKLFRGNDMTKTKAAPVKTTTAKAKPAATETDGELLKRSLSQGDWSKVATATDDELRVLINEAWRKKLVAGPRKYTVATAHKKWGTAIWFDTVSQSDEPSLYANGDVVSLLVSVRDVLNVAFTDVNEAPAPKITKAQAKANEAAMLAGVEFGPVEMRPVDWFTQSPYQRRAEPTAEWLDELGDSMLRKQLEPVIARPTGELISGHTRVAAAKRKKIKQLETRIAICDEATAQRLVLLYNAKRQDLTQRERCRHFNDLLAMYTAAGLTQVQLARHLDMGESTLANELRLGSLPDSLWARQEAGGLSIAQARRLAVHAARPLFVEGFLGHMKTVACEINIQPEPHHFEAAYRKGVERAFRPLKKDMFGKGCLFKVTPELRELLDIVDVDGEEMAANVELWNQSNAAAKTKAKEKEEKKQATAAAPIAPKKGVEKAKDDERRRNRERYLAQAWDVAFAVSIADRFSGKLKKVDTPILIRLALLVQRDASEGQMRIGTAELIADDAVFVDRCLEVVQTFFNPHQQHDGWVVLHQDELRAIARWLEVDPLQYWRPTAALLNTMTDAELLDTLAESGLAHDEPFFAAETQADDGVERGRLVDFLVESWPVGWVADEFVLAKPTKRKGGRS